MTYYDSSKFPFVKENFISKGTCDNIINYAKNNSSYLFKKDGHDNDFWDGRVAHAGDIKEDNPDLFNMMLANRFDIKLELINLLAEPRYIYSDSLQIVRWPAEYELHPHADKEHSNGTPHPFPWRDFATIVYLNNDFEGGEIHFPHKDVEIKPSPGMLVVFPGTVEFLHGVRPIKKDGVRYTLASFMTFDSSKDDGL